MKISCCLFLVISSFFFVTAHADTPAAHAVSSAHPLATQAGIEILQQGGNAFDAAVAVSAALAVVEPVGSGLGGGGFWLLHRASDNTQVMIDGREKAPAAAHKRMYQDEEGNFLRKASLFGPLAAGIPGEPAALVHIAENYGNLPLKTTLAPAIRYAEEGFPVTMRYHRAATGMLEFMKKYPSTAEIFLRNGEQPLLGEMIKQTDLANVLKKIAEEGKEGFYKGEIADKLIKGVQQYGGIWTHKDLADYRIVERKPIVVDYRGTKLTVAPPPSSGGIVLAQALKILENFDLSTMDSIARKHHIIEAMRRAYRDRAVFLGDPDYVHIPVNRLLDEDYLDGLAVTINPDAATPSSELGDTPQLQQRGTATTHFSIIDKEGNRVAATLSINIPFGSSFVVPGTGVLLNDEMDDFSSKPFTPNNYGLIGQEANAIEPGKRPLSSMLPTFIEAEDRVGILGTPGGSRIISMVLLGVLDFVKGNPPESWVNLPRYHHQYLPDVVQHELGALRYLEEKGLRDKGHQLKVINPIPGNAIGRYGNMNAIMWDKKQNKIYAASDPRGEGAARIEE